MEYILYLFRFIYRIRWWLIIAPLCVAFMVYSAYQGAHGNYTVQTTVYTGVESGYGIEGQRTTGNPINAMANLINIMSSESTLRRVSFRLFARNMINGDLEKDNNIITAGSYREIYNRAKNHRDLMALIDKTSEDKTVENLYKYEKQDPDNFVYGLFHYFHPHYSYNALKNIRIEREGQSDLLQISYSCGDPGVAYNTLEILLKEFVSEYRELRYGETDKVIDYFEEQLRRSGHDLRVAEDSLMEYNIDKKIINYSSETDNIAGLNSTYELQQQTVMIAYNSSKALMDELETRMGDNLKMLKNNKDFLSKLDEASNLSGKVTEIESFSANNSEDISASQNLKNYKERLSKATGNLYNIADTFTAHKYSKEGVDQRSILSLWLEQLLIHEKAKADLAVIQESQEANGEKYAYYAPIGSTLKRKERDINFKESNYMNFLTNYNSALMRKKNLEMTATTIKVLNPPSLPLSPESIGRKKLVMLSYASSMMLIVAFFLLLEVMDRTLRDKIRAERLIGSRISSGFPGKANLQYRSYNRVCDTIASRQLSTVILPFFKQKKKDNYPYIMGIISMEPQEGKSYISEQLRVYWERIGLRVKILNWENDFSVYSREYTLAQSLEDIYTPTGEEDILIIEYPNLKKFAIPEALLHAGNINTLVVRGNRAWKETDKNIFNELKELSGKTPLRICLNKISRNEVEGFTGMLPPYSRWRKLEYRFSHLGLTETEQHF